MLKLLAQQGTEKGSQWMAEAGNMIDVNAIDPSSSPSYHRYDAIM